MEAITTRQARAILEAIPTEKWTNSGMGCALALLERTKNPGLRFLTHPKEFTSGLYSRSVEFSEEKHGERFSIVAVNDGYTGIRRFYPQSTPKDRVMMLLSDMIAAGY